MKAILPNISVDTLTEKLVHESVSVNKLNLAYENHRKAFGEALKKRPKLLTKVSEENEKAFFKFALKEDYKYLIYLPREKYTNELVQIYLEARINEEKNQKAEGLSYRVSAQKSLDDKILLSYLSVTPSDDEIYYFDKELNIPVSLKSSIKAVLKLNAPLILVDSMDLAVTQLGFNAIKSMLNSEIDSLYKAKMATYIKNNNVGYYSLSASTAEFEAQFKSELNERMSEFGLEVKEFSVNKISIPQESRLMLEDQAFRIRQRKEEFEADNEFAKKSLENYENKLSIQNKYPSAQHSLTEYEKDLALKRYLIKTGKWKEDELDHTNRITQTIGKNDDELKKQKDIVPIKKNSFVATFVFITIVLMIFSFSMMGAASVGVGLIFLGCTIGLMGTIAAFNYTKFGKAKTQTELIVEDEEKEDVEKRMGDEDDE